MYEIAKHEFTTWIDSLDNAQLTDYEKTILNIIIRNFESVAKLSTARGGRAKYLGEKITELKNKTLKDIPELMSNSVAMERIERIESLEVENFRGFGAVQTFQFDKQYTFFHGPNGSGKTSFCEALEYSTLGMIEEATARSISLDKYILHAGKKKVQKPIMICKYSSGVSKQCVPNYNDYRFGFVEKNRIDGFSHIGAATAKTQTERMAALFGLSEFQEFVKGFSETIDNKYFSTEEHLKEDYVKALEAKENLQKQINETKSEITLLQNEIEKIIVNLGCKEVTTYDEAIAFFLDSQNGLITQYTKDANENKWTMLKISEFSIIAKSIDSLINQFETIQKNNADILSDVGSVNLINFYNAILKVEREDFCPACHTPLKDVVSNPFELAKAELEKFKKIEGAKKAVKESAQSILNEYTEVYAFIEGIAQTGLINSINVSAFANKNLQISDIEILNDNIIFAFAEIKKVKAILDDTENLVNNIKEYNQRVEEHNKEYDEKLSKAQEIYKKLVELNSGITTRNDSITKWEKQIADGAENLKSLKLKTEIEAVSIAFNREMVDAYNSIVGRLKSYVLELPINMAHDLSEKIRDYYNLINEDDAEFELIEELKLPVVANEKIIIKMEDGIEQDALQILSEGHVRILGLSILLAKAMYEKTPFLIFDDIVNSVDDDHRDGVAKLLITHPDFVGTQMILTCHGELFVSKLEDYVVNKKDMVRYMFLPADSLEERGIFIKYQDASLPLQNAREKYEDGMLKDSAAKCRQAVECITGKLWKKVSGYIDGGISVKIRGLNNGPDLYNIATALYGSTKHKFVEGIDEIHEDLGKLKEDSMWSVLNKGTHIDDKIPEFNRGEVKKLLELLEKMAKEVDDLKIKPIVKE